MKNFLFVLVFISFFILSFYMLENKKSNTIRNEEDIEEVRAIFVSYLELEKYIKDKSEKESKKNIVSILDNLKENKFNSVILHVRPFADAIYNSKIFPLSDTVKVNGNPPSYDILKYFLDEAHKRNILVHAWINPYRISTSSDISKLNSMFSNFIKNNDAKVIEGKGIFFNPSSSNVNKIIMSGIKELITNYDVDGIHYDDYFYPSDNIDTINYEDYLNEGGESSLDDFRYGIILSLIKDTYWTIKSIKPNVLFGISPEGNIDNNYNTHYLDIKKILSEEGYVDYIMPQIYFGFNNSNKPFIKTLNEWNNLIKTDIKIIPALAFYKSGEYDKYAGSGEYEWVTNNDIISKEVLETKKVSKYGGFSIFRYDSMFSPNNDNKKNEFIKLQEVLK